MFFSYKMPSLHTPFTSGLWGSAFKPSNKMKLLAFIVVAVIALTTANEFSIKNKADLMKFRKECAKSTNVTAELIEKYKKFEFPDEQTTRCYIACIFEKFGLFNPESGFQMENLVKQLGQNRNKEEVKIEIEKCVDKNEQTSDAHAWVFRGFKCFISNNLPLVQESLNN